MKLSCATLQADCRAGLVDTGFIGRLIQHEATTKFVLDNGAVIHALPITDIDQNRLFLHLSVDTCHHDWRQVRQLYFCHRDSADFVGKKRWKDLSMLYDLLFCWR